jgi:hypothetical protein
MIFAVTPFMNGVRMATVYISSIIAAAASPERFVLK